MATYRLTFIFNLKACGWTETWYVERTALSAAKTSAVAIGEKRVPLLCIGASLEACRVSDVDIDGDATVVKWGEGYSGENGSGLLRDEYRACYLIRAESQGLYRRNVYLRGLPDAWTSYINTGQEEELPATFRTPLSAWKNVLILEQARIHAFSKVAADVGKVKVTDAFKGVGQFIEYQATGHTFAVGDLVRVSGLQGVGSSLANRQGTVSQAVAGQTFQLKAVLAAADTITIVKGGIARRRVKKYFVIDEVFQQRATKRDTGRPFFSPRGARRAKKI